MFSTIGHSVGANSFSGCIDDAGKQRLVTNAGDLEHESRVSAWRF